MLKAQKEIKWKYFWAHKNLIILLHLNLSQRLWDLRGRSYVLGIIKLISSSEFWLYYIFVRLVNLKNGSTPASFSFIFCFLQTNIITILTTLDTWWIFFTATLFFKKTQTKRKRDPMVMHLNPRTRFSQDNYAQLYCFLKKTENKRKRCRGWTR